MLHRRDFLKRTSALALGSFALQSHAAELFGPNAMPKAGVQLFTTMSIIDKDLSGTLKQIAAIGYKNIESAFSMKGGYYGLKPKEFAQLVKDLGMTWQSHHVIGAPFRMPPPKPAADGKEAPTPGRSMSMPPMKTLQANYQELVDEAAEGGIKYLVCASTPIKTMDEVYASAEALQRTGEACKKAGIVFAYHNHSAEFEEIEGKLPFDVFSSQIGADILKFELDIAWAIKAGVDPIALFKKHAGRFPLWHVKDLNQETKKPVAIGEGYIDYKPIFAAAKTAGMQSFFIEQDGAPAPIENLATSFNNLKKVLA